MATDVAGRGIDIQDVSMVVNYDMAKNIEGECRGRQLQSRPREAPCLSLLEAGALHQEDLAAHSQLRA